ncbi:ribbon-helix-helix protein, CopG family [Nocardia amamiensis]|uniref:Ribbon-helix-helix protein, CopG family n=1 Tax=Nocardia amamiensis TaxID=404578 RepID=A0ABS0D0D5_9NOCA|nr:CopG family transcriptional regulator [Nocardia amamiensis]MBF6302305.1 ribbon-helix-helix protein, CopG family [Nocardia amamiensis]
MTYPEDLRTPTEVDDDDLNSALEEATEDWERPRPGRPEIGGAALIRFGDLLARVDERSREESINRAELVRRAVRAYLEPVEPTIEAVRRHLRSGFTTVLVTSGTSAPAAWLCRTPEEAVEMLDSWADIWTRDGRCEIVARSDRHVAARTTDESTEGMTMTCAIVDAAPVKGGLVPRVNKGEADLCRRLGLDPDDLWP